MHEIHVDWCLRWLAGEAGNVTSQYGEDGLVDAIFGRIGTNNRWCFEVGAHDGFYLSNTWRLREEGWDAVLIEAAGVNFEQLATYRSERVRTIHEKVEGEALDRILTECGAPADPDLGVIDVDGQDYWLWYHLHRHTPRVLMIEFSPHERIARIPTERTGGYQAGFEDIRELGELKGYTLAARTHVNAIFVQATEGRL